MFFDDPQISNIIFYPRKHSLPTQLEPFIDVLKFQISDEILIGGFFYQNDLNLPTILLFHGNGEIAFEYQYFAPLFFECGVNLAVVDYRGYGFSTGRPAFSKLFEDAYPVYQQFTAWMKEKGLNDSHFILGRSLGSTCAAEIGSKNPAGLRGVIFESGIGSALRILTDLFSVNIPQDTLDSLKEWSNDTKAAKFKKPVLIIHGTSDWIVPSKHAQILFDALPDAIEKKLVYIEGAGHNTIFQFKDEYFKPLKNFIEEFK
ncbi:MAG: alpha/beta fold hydrolase [Candidatus Helarchaeota archaeon]|nr:alpha/beta fold hydrolase [Candidatus Helarchaeota archaeon]